MTTGLGRCRVGPPRYIAVGSSKGFARNTPVARRKSEVSGSAADTDLRALPKTLILRVESAR